MAKVVGPLMSHQASGSVGGIVYSRAPGGTNVRARISPIDKRTRVRGDYRRLGMGRTAFEFSNISASDSATWPIFAESHTVQSSVGVSTKISGFAWYMRFGIPAYYYWNGVLTHAPLTLRASIQPRFNIEWTSSGALLSWDTTLVDSQSFVVRQWRNLLVSQNYSNRWVYSHLIQYPAVSPVLLTPPAGGDGGPGTLPPIILGRYIDFLVYTTDGGGARSPHLRFRVQADS